MHWLGKCRQTFSCLRGDVCLDPDCAVCCPHCQTRWPPRHMDLACLCQCAFSQRDTHQVFAVLPVPSSRAGPAHFCELYYMAQLQPDTGGFPPFCKGVQRCLLLSNFFANKFVMSMWRVPKTTLVFNYNFSCSYARRL